MFVSSGIRALDLRAMATDGASGAQGAKIVEISPAVHGVQTFRAETTAQISTLRDSLERDREDMAALRTELTARFDALMARLEPAENPSLRFGCFGSLPPPSDSPVARVRGTTPSSTDGSPLSMFMGNSASSRSKAPQSGPLPTPASYCTPPPHRLPSNQNQWVPLPQAVHVISSPSSPPPQRNPYPLPPQPNHTEFCQLSLGPTALPLTASNPSSSPLLSVVPAHREVSHSGPASALVDEHEKLSQPSSVAVTDKLSFTSPKYKRDDVDVPIGTTPCVAIAGAPPLDSERSSLHTDPTTFEVISHTNTDNEMDVVLLGVGVNADSAQLLMYGLVASYKLDISTSHQSLPHIREVYSRSFRSVGTLISGAMAPLGRPLAAFVPIVGCLSPVSLTSAVIVDITETELATHGFSIVNLDWRCDTTVELYVMLQSLWQKDEELKSVVYSSNFGIELIEAEDIHCSAGLFDDQDGMQEEDPIVICGSASEISPEDRNKVNIAATGKNPKTAQLTTAWVTSRVITSSVTVSFAHDSLVGIILVDGVSATENVSRAKDVMMLKSKEPRHSYHHTRRVGEGYPGSMWLYSTDMVPFSWSQHLYEEEKVDEDAAYLVMCSYHGNKYFIVMPNPTKWNISGSLKISAPSANCTKEPSPRISLSSVTSKSLAFESFTCSYLSRNIAQMKASDPSTVLKVVTAISVQQLTILVFQINAHHHSAPSLMDASVPIFGSHFSNNVSLFILSCNEKQLVKALQRLFFLKEHVLFGVASPNVLRVHHHVLPSDKSIHPTNYHFEGEHFHRILIFFVHLVVVGSIVARTLIPGSHPSLACILYEHHSVIVEAAIIMRKLCVAVLYTPVCSTDILKSISKFYPLRYSSDSLERVVVFMTPMHKPFQYVVKEEFVMTMSTSTFNSPTHALRKLVSLLLVDVHSSPPILDNMLREAEKLILGTLMVRYITELLPLKFLQQGLDIVIHYRLLAFVSSSHLLHCSEGENLGIISIMQHLYDWQSTSYPPESVHLSALLHTWQVTTRDGIDFGAALTTILASVTMHFCSTARHSTIGVIGATLVMFLTSELVDELQCVKAFAFEKLEDKFH